MIRVMNERSSLVTLLKEKLYTGNTWGYDKLIDCMDDQQYHLGRSPVFTHESHCFSEPIRSRIDVVYSSGKPYRWIVFDFEDFPYVEGGESSGDGFDR